jgi:hypothetical protein
VKNLVDAEPIHDTHFSQNPVNVVFHRLLGNIEVICDFLIAKAAANQRNKLLFAPRQSPMCVFMAIREFRGLRRHKVKENLRVMRWADGVSLCDRPDRRYHVCGGGILEDVTARTATYRRQEATPIICHGDEHALDRLVVFASRGWRGKAIAQKVL